MPDDSRDAARFARDVRWNVVSLAIGGGCGILLTYLISLVYDSATLGAFNQVYAFYILFSQLAVLGIGSSALTYIAGAELTERRAIATSALLLTAVIGTVAAAVSWLAAGVLGDVLDSPDVSEGIVYAAPGVLLFALNKVTLSCLNGLRRMRLYAVFFGGRFVWMIAGFAVCAAYDVDGAALPIVLTFAELMTFVMSLAALHAEVGAVAVRDLQRWAVTHLRFGSKGFMSGMISELNTRVDVLVLGAFTSDAIVGAYSFAAILAEGFLQLLVVLRNNFAPILIKLWSKGHTAELMQTVRRARNRTYLGAVVVGGLAVAGYIVFVPLVTTQPELADSWPYFAVLIAGIVASAGYVPFHQLLLYGGFPGWHTILMVGIVAGNAVANVILIAAMGALGAAIATAIALVLGVVLLRVLVGWKMRLAI